MATPISSLDLAPGDFWPLPLCTGRHAAGVMLAHATRGGRRDRANVLVGLLDWVGDQPPSVDDVLAAPVLHRAFVHVRAIEACGGRVIGRVARDWGPPEVDFDALAGRVIPGWGQLVMLHRAEMKWGDAKAMQQRLKAAR